MFRVRIFALILAGAAAVCLIGLPHGGTQSTGLRRVTNTTEEGSNLNPSISGDGRIVAFESTEDIAGAGGADHFRAIRANIGVEPPTFVQMGGSRAVTPAISQDGSRIAFASKDDPLGTNPDGNSEIFLFDGTKLLQITNTTPGSVAKRVTDGNFQPSMSDDGRFIAFSSNRNLASLNADANLEIFIYDTVGGGFAQLTNTTGIIGASDAKISGNGASVAYIRDPGATASARRDLLEQPRGVPAPAQTLATNVLSLAMTYGRAISDDGTRVVYAAETATNTTQVFLYDGRGGTSTRQITSLGSRVTEVPLHPTISGDGTHIAFATRRNVNGLNSDGSVELYVFDVPSSQMSRITTAPSSATAAVVSSLNDDGSVVAFNFPRVLSRPPINSDQDNACEIYSTGTPPRPSTGALTVLNGASFGHEPSTIKAVAPDSIAVALGGSLANTTMQAPQNPDRSFPTNVAGTTVTVNGRAAQIFYVSPSQVNFLVPPQTEIGTAEVIVTNPENFTSRGTVVTLRAAPGVFTRPGDGTGEGVILSTPGLMSGPFDPSDGNLTLIVFSTGARFGTQTLVVIGGRVLTAEYIFPEPDMPGLDEVRVKVPADLRGAGTVDLFVQSDGRASNPVSITFTGDGTRDILVNEMLADPPTGTPGDANRDGVRDGADDEFIELVNTTTHDINMSGYQLFTRSSSTTTDTLRHTFAPNTILPACTAIVVFGGGTFDPANPAFGGSQVLKALSGGLSLTNTGGVITLRDQSNGVVTSFVYGGSTGLNADAGQSLTRSPDVTGNFTLHSTATGSNGRLFSPGTRVNGNPFAVCPAIARIDVTPVSPSIDAGAKQQFTAAAFDANNNPVSGVIFFWQSSNTAVATIDQNGLATSSSDGTTQITASARGVTSAPDTLTVRPVTRVLTRVDVTPPTATIPATGAQQFTAHGIDQFGNEIVGLTFTWESTNLSAATIDQTGLATGVAQGQSTIKATTQNVTGTATLNVTAPTVVINEVLADPPAAIDGDANHDGVRDSADDEFVELVNATAAGINVSGWTVRTHSTTTTTETVRHTFAANTTIPAGEAMVVFGGGTFNPADPLFGCAQVVKASSGGLSLTNGGLTILIRDGSGNLVTQFSYGGSTGLNGGNAQSLTRSPDITGSFVLHTTPPTAGGRKFSSGLKLDGTPFGACNILTIADVTASEGDAGTTTFNFVVSLSQPAPAGGVTFTIATQDNTATFANNDYVPRSTGAIIPAGQQTYTFAVTVNGDVNIEPDETFFVNVTNVASAIVADGQAVGTIQNDDSPSLSIDDVTAAETNAGTTTFTFHVNLTLPAGAAGVTFDIATADGTATVANNDYVARALTGQTIPAGQSSYNFDVTVNGDTVFEPNETFVVNVTNIGGAVATDGQGVGTIQNDDASTLVISQTYPGGGLTGATYTNDFIELFNRGTTTVDFSVTPYSVQFLSTGAATWSKTDLTTGTIAPGQYFLIKETGGANGAALPAADVTGSINLTSTTAGKVALVSGTTLLTGNCPGDDGTTPFNPAGGTVVDFVGYAGTAATANHCYEGSGPAAFTLSNNTIADFRKAGGCTDTNDNTADFLVSAPLPRNSSSPFNNCVAGPAPNLTINDVTIAEGNSGTTTATFTVSLSAPALATDVTFDIATQNNTATTANSDYVAKTLTSQVILAGQQTYTFTVTINGDTVAEPDETFFVNVTNASGATVTDGQGLGTIQNDDVPSLSINDVSLNEGNGGPTTFSFTVNLSTAAPAGGVTFDITTQDNTATVADSDYVQRTLTTQTIPAGSSTYNFDVTVNGDVTIEPNEAFFVNVTSVTGATVSDGQGVGTILNDDSPTLSINDVAAAEANSGTTIFTFTVTSSLPAPVGGITFDIATADGTAQDDNPASEDNDYVARSLTGQTITAGNTTYTFDVTVNGDLVIEPNETFFVNITNASGATINDGVGQGTIQNDDTPNLVVSQIYPGGGLSGASFTNDFVELFNRGTSPVDFSVTPFSVQFLSTGGSAWVKTDLTTGTILPGGYFLVKETSGGAAGASLPAADVTGSINLTSTTPGKVALVIGTTLLAGNCPGDDGTTPFNPVDGTVVDFVGYLGNATTTNHCYEGSGPAPFTSGNNTIADFRKAGGCTDTNDNAADFLVSAPFPRNSSSPLNNCVAGAPPNLSINDVTVTEGNAGTTIATFTVSLSAAAPSTDISFDIATQDNSATTANSDYVLKTLTNQIIPAGQTTYSFSVTVNGDVAVEPDENFFVNVTNVSGATISDGQGVGTIQNDDQPGLSINDVALNEGNGGPTTFSFTVSLSSPAPAGGVTFDIATQDNTATLADNDYVQRTLTSQTIPAGNSTYNFDVTVNGDLTIEPTESFFVNVTSVTGATVSDGQGVGTIQNDDSPTLSITDVSQTETNSGTTIFTFTVSSSLPAPAGGITFDIATADGTAQDDTPASEDNDYVARSLTGQTITAGNTTYTFDVTVNGDTLVEPNETFLVNVTNAVNATILDGQGVGTIQNDDTSGLVISQTYPGGGLTGATYQNDFVELFNRGTTTVDFAVTPYSIQFLSTGASTWAKTDLTSGTMAPGQYFLIKGAGGANGAVLPTADATGTLNLTSTTAGKVALISNTTLLTGNCPGDDGSTPFNPVAGAIVDFVGYLGTAATANHCYEGAGPAPFTSGNNTLADFRKANGCTETNDNAADFVTAAPAPRNSASPLNNCSATPSLTIDNVTIAEGNAGPTVFNFTVSLSAPAPAGGVTFDIATQNDSATLADSDYVANTLTSQTITAGNQTYNFAVTVNGDVTVEPDETFFVNVSNVVGATVADGQGLGTIQNDDSAALPNLSINDVTLAEGNALTTTFAFTVTLSAPAPAGGVTFNIATADGTAQDDNPAATEDNDYVAQSLTSQTITAGNTTYTFNVTVNGDAVVEANETFFVNVTSVTNATVTDGQGQGTITNDDSAVTPAIVISQVYGGGNNASATYNADFVELFNRTGTPVDITSWSIQYQSAATTSGAAWTVAALCPSGTCTIPANAYYLVRLTAPGGTGSALPTPDSIPTTTINMAATAGKVALVSNTTALTGPSGSGCPSSFASIIDFVGYGSGAGICFEGSGASPGPAANVTSVLRKLSGCQDTDNNSADFTATTTAAARNSSTTNICP